MIACVSTWFDDDDGEYLREMSSWTVLFWRGKIFMGGIVVVVDVPRNISKSHTTPCFLQFEQVG
jgi:hypothetical protein